MSECVSLSRPTRVLSVIPVTGAPFFASEFNHPNVPLFTGPSPEVTAPPIESTDALAAGPKNGITSTAAGPWTKHPGDVDALVQSLAAGLTGAVHWGGARKTKRKLGHSAVLTPKEAASPNPPPPQCSTPYLFRAT